MSRSIDSGDEDMASGQGRDSLLTGEQLEEYCLQHGLCPLCARTKTHDRVGPFRLKLAGSKTNSEGPQWKPLTVSWTEHLKKEKDGQKQKKKGLFGKGKESAPEYSFDSASNDADEPDAENGNFMVYRGFCLRPGCFTLDQAKRLKEMEKIRE